MIQGRPLVAGRAEGRVLASNEPLSFWGGYDHKTGEIIDRRHPLSGATAAGAILALPFTSGSSTSTPVLLEAARTGTAPAAVITSGVDSFLSLASIVAGVMYGTVLPIVAVSPEDFCRLETGDWLRIDTDGQITVVSERPSGASLRA